MPLYTGVLMVFPMADVGLLGTSGSVGEFMTSRRLYPCAEHRSAIYQPSTFPGSLMSVLTVAYRPL